MAEKESESRIKSSGDVKCFLYDVQIRPDIWDCSLVNYPSKKKKAAAWEEICRKYSHQDFDSLTAKEKKGLTNDLQNKWKQLRLSFVREYNKYYNKEGQLNYGGRKPKYSDSLTFLVPALQSKQWSGKYGNPPVMGEKKQQHASESDMQYEVIEHFDVSMNEDNPHDHDVSNAKQVTSLKREEGTNSQIRDSELTVEDSFSLSREANDARDEDKLFLLSLLSHLKEIPKEKKLLARCEIMHVLVKYAKPKS